MDPTHLNETVDAVAHDTDFSGVVSVRVGDETAFEAAYGFADREHERLNTPETRFGIASGTKGFTALTVMRLVDAGTLELTTTARSVLGSDLPRIDDDVTVEQLLAHRSGIGDYLDEDLLEDVEGWPLPIGAQDLAVTADYLTVLDGHTQKFPPDQNFSYCNGGYVVLALLCERMTGTAFPDLVQTHVTTRADLGSTAFLDVNDLPPDTAVGYLADGRPNPDNLPRGGSGDGGISSNVADIAELWHAVFAGSIVTAEVAAAMVAPRSTEPRTGKRYGLGFWLDPADTRVSLEGCDAGVSFRSTHDRSRDLTTTVVSNSTDGAWPLVRALEATVEP
ncbi:MAG: serine hydrolase domain-containing protein [Acidimicrobiia bacterium]